MIRSWEGNLSIFEASGHESSSEVPGGVQASLRGRSCDGNDASESQTNDQWHGLLVFQGVLVAGNDYEDQEHERHLPDKFHGKSMSDRAAGKVGAVFARPGKHSRVGEDFPIDHLLADR